MSTDYEIKKTNKVKQLKLKATYNKKIVHEILDAGLVAYVAFSQDDGPVVVPMIYGRKNDTIFLLGKNCRRTSIPLWATVVFAYPVASANELPWQGHCYANRSF